MNKKEVAAALEEIAVLLELAGENPFKTRAYTGAARAVEQLSEDLAGLIESGELKQVKGIGKSIYEKIAVLVQTGRLPYIEALHKKVPQGLLDMIHIPGFGPKRARLVHQKLGIASLDELERACKEDRLSGLEGFGKKLEANILEGIAFIRGHSGRILYANAVPPAHALLEVVQECPETIRAQIAGSIRRCRETVKDVDIIAAVTDSGPVMAAFTQADNVEKIVARGETKSSVILRSGLAADLRTVSAAEFPYALHHFTGSAEHNIAMRGRAQQKFGIKINEYGLFTGGNETRIKVTDEEGFFKRLGLQYIPPELRENTGEIEAAERNTLPRLVTREALRGLLHVHTTASDGSDSLEAMATAARETGYEYVGINDHSKAASYAGGLSEKEVHAQQREIDRLNKTAGSFRILKSIECDILPDGSLDFAPKLLDTFDYVIASIHANFTMPRDHMTRRILKALKAPHTSILGHPTGRLLLARKPYEFDMDEIIRAAADLGVALELNAYPNRLDLAWAQCKAAKEAGAKIAIGVDAHSAEKLAVMEYGLNIARKGWLEPPDILNCLPVDKFVSFCKKRRG